MAIYRIQQSGPTFFSWRTNLHFHIKTPGATKIKNYTIKYLNYKYNNKM